MDTSAPIRLLPYGNSDFETIRRANKYYVDKTMFIPALEKYDYQMFLRPRRFGKSLLLNMLAAYYDIAYKDSFDALFGDLAIGKNPTINHNSYLILKFNFSAVDPDPEKVNTSFNDLVLQGLTKFCIKYKDLLPEGTAALIGSQKESNTAYTILSDTVQLAGHHIYVLIDEYDKPLLNSIGNPELQDAYRSQMKAFYSVMKTQDRYIKFGFITGVTLPIDGGFSAYSGV